MTHIPIAADTRTDGHRVTCVKANENDMAGVNSKAELAAMEQRLATSGETR